MSLYHKNVLNNNNIDRNDNKLGTEVNEKKVCLSSKCVASVACVADIHTNDGAISSRPTTDGKADLPVLPCLWCDYKHPIEFDLGNHLMACHRDELLKLPIGKGSMEIRIDYAIQQTKRMMAAQYDDEDDYGDIAEENDEDGDE
jgi:hypothetical protein